MKICPICGSSMCEYRDNSVIESICWDCGHYESDSQAYREHPELFEGIVREKPQHFIEKFLIRKLSDDFSQRKPSDEDYTEPKIVKI